MLNDDDFEDTRDPLRAAFEDYVPAPRDVVPKQPYTGTNEDLHALDGQTLPVTYWDRDAWPTLHRERHHHPPHHHRQEGLEQ
jgi:hypothetical protein